MHGMIEQMLAGKIENSAGLQNWVAQSGPANH
jgi:hypothetical protein